MSSSGTATGLGAMTPATRPVSSRALHVAPIEDACRGGGYLVAACRAELERRREPTRRERLVASNFAIWAEKTVFIAVRRWQADGRRLLPRREKARRNCLLLFAKGGKRPVMFQRTPRPQAPRANKLIYMYDPSSTCTDRVPVPNPSLVSYACRAEVSRVPIR